MNGSDYAINQVAVVRETHVEVGSLQNFVQERKNFRVAAAAAVVS